MADPQLEKGYTRIANELLEAVCRTNLSGSELRILLYIIRRTYGFNRSYAEMPLSEISEAVGIRKNHISEALKRLSANKIIELHPNKGTRPQTVSIVKNYEEWAVESCETLLFPKTGTVPENGNSTVPENGNSTVPENGNSTVPENGNHTYKENIKERFKESFKESKSEKQAYGKCGKVLLTDEEYNDLVRGYGKDTIGRYIERMDNWIVSRGVKNLECYSELKVWLDRDGIAYKNIDVSRYEEFINDF